MSVILYSKASYDALAKTITFQAAFRELRLDHYYETPLRLCEQLWELNCKSFRDRYAGTTNEDIEAERLYPEPDLTFEQLLKADRLSRSPQKAAALYLLFGRIDYQLCEAAGFQDNPLSWHIRWIQDHAAREMADFINQTASVKQERRSDSDNATT